MNLLERANAVERKLADIKVLDQRANEFETLRERRDALRNALRTLRGANDRLNEFRAMKLCGGIQPPVAAKASEAALELSKVFAADRRSATLTAGQRWKKFLAELQRAQDSAEALSKATWQDFVQTEFALKSPKELEPEIPPSPENQAAFAIYCGKFNDAEGRLRQSQGGASQIPAIRVAVKDALAAYSQLKFDYPPAVAEFLRQSMTPTGLPLDRVSGEVLDWLNERNMLSRYVVRKK